MSEKEQAEKGRALLDFCRAMSRSPLIGTDIKDAAAWYVRRDFIQEPGGHGILIQFVISCHASGKVNTGERDSLDILLNP